VRGLFRWFAITATLIVAVFLVSTAASAQTAPEQGQSVTATNAEGVMIGEISWPHPNEIAWAVTVESIRGNPVFVEYRPVYDGLAERIWLPLTDSTTTSQAFDGTISRPPEIAIDGVQFRTCFNRPEPEPSLCGDGDQHRVYRR